MKASEKRGETMSKNAISKSFTFPSLIRFTLPTMVMMVVFSLYTIVDGVFVSRFVGTNALSGINIVFPAVSLTYAIAIMLATGGSAIIAKKLGEGDSLGARQDFSMFTLIAVITGVVLAVIGLLFLEPIVRMLGATDLLMGYCMDYLRILLFFFPMSMLQLVYQAFFVTEGKPNIGLGLTIGSGAANILLDYLFIVPMGMGIAGAAWGTAIGQSIPAVAGTLYFMRKKANLRFTRPKFSWRTLGLGCFNGSSEMVTNLSGSITTLLFNLAMIHFAGEDGVAAMSIVLYAQFLFIALYFGFSQGVAPVISYHYGSQNPGEIKKLFRYSMIFVCTTSVAVMALAIFSAPYITSVFAPRDSAVYNMTVHGFLLFSVSFLLSGVNIFASAFFTALSNGKLSALISFLRTFVFIVAGIMLLPFVLGLDGVWLSIPFAEGACLVLSVFLLVKRTKPYFWQRENQREKNPEKRFQNTSISRALSEKG